MLTQCDWAGRALQEAGDLTRAVPIIADTLADRLRVLGADHPDTLASRNNLAYAYRSAGRLDEATGLFEKVLADCERVLGSDHPVTSAVGDNLVDARAAGSDG